MIKKLRWQILVVVLTLAVVAALLLAQQPGQTIFIPQPSTGGIYTEGLVGAMGRLNPLLDLNNPVDRDVDRLIFSGLVKFDQRGLPAADLASSWGTSVDGRTYNFSIRPEAVWHDGVSVTTDDVIFTLDLIKNNASLYPPDIVDLWQKVEVKRLDDKTIQFNLPEPFAPFLDYLTFGVLPKHLLENITPDQLANADFDLKPIGSGPYQFDSLLIENGRIAGVTLKAFDKYYGKPAFIEKMVLRYYPDSISALKAYQQREVLAIGNVTADALAGALAEPNLSVFTARLPQMSIVLFNLQDPEATYLATTNVRVALMRGLNRQYLVDRLLGGQAIVADGPLFPGTWAYYDGLEHISYDPDAATALLKKEGYVIPATGGTIRAKDNQVLSFTLLHPDDALHTALAQSIQSDWAKIGVEVKLQALPYAQLVNDNLSNRTYQAALVDLNLARTPDPDPYPFWHQSEITGGQNYSGWDNRTASEYIEQARITTDINVRTRLYRNFQVIFAKELPALPLYFPVYSFAVDAQVYGVQVPPLFDTSDRYFNVTDWYLVTRRTVEKTSQP
jgi:peptide/nickel transport system substrate-binding protein